MRRYRKRKPAKVSEEQRLRQRLRQLARDIADFEENLDSIRPIIHGSFRKLRTIEERSLQNLSLSVSRVWRKNKDA